MFGTEAAARCGRDLYSGLTSPNVGINVVREMGKKGTGSSDWTTFVASRVKQSLLMRISSANCIHPSVVTPNFSAFNRYMSTTICRGALPASHLGQAQDDEQLQAITRITIEIVTTMQCSRQALKKARCPNSSVDRPLHPLVSIRVAPSAWRPKLGLMSLVPSYPSTLQQRRLNDLKKAPFSSIFRYAETGSQVNDGKPVQNHPNRTGDCSPEARNTDRKHTSYRGREAGSTGKSKRGMPVVDEICDILMRPDNWHQIRQMNLKLDTCHVGEVLKRQEDVHLALSFFDWASAQPGFRHNMFTYHIMIRILTRSRNFDHALRLVDEMHRTGFKPDVVTFTILISGFGAANRLQSALEVLNVMREVGCRPNIITYNILINIHKRSGMYEDAWKLFKQMQEEGVQINAPTYSSIINCLGKAGHVSAAKKLFAEMKERGCVPDVITYTTIIDLHAKAGLYQESIECYREMQAIGLKPDMVILCAVMDCLGKAGDVTGANRIFEDMKNRGYSPDDVAYTNIIVIHAKSGLHEKAVQLFNEMREMGVQPNIVNYNCILDCLGKVGKVNAASKLFKEMKTLGCTPDLKTYSMMMCLHARLGLKDTCLQLFEEVQQAGLQPSTTILVAMIDCLGKVGDFNAAWSLFSEIKAQGYTLDVVCYTRMIDICSKCGHYNKALEVYMEMQEANVEPNIFTYNALIHCLGKFGNRAAAHTLFCEMQQRGCKPNIVTYNTLMDLYSKAGKLHLSLEIFTKLETDDVQPDSVTFITMMEAFSKAGHPAEAENIFKRMEEAGHDAQRPAYNILIDAWGKTGNMEKVDHWYKELVKSGLTPDEVTAKCLIVAYLRAHKYDLVRQAIRILSATGFSDDCSLAAILLQHCSALDQQEHVDSMLNLIAELEQATYSFALMLLSSSSENVKADCKSFFDSLQDGNDESKIMFVDALIWFLYSQNRSLEAGHVWDYAAANGFYPQAVLMHKTPSHWTMDFHNMSVGTAVVALRRILADFRDVIVRKKIVPGQVSVITGWGRGSKVPGCSTVKLTIQETLDALRSPFNVDGMNAGCFVCSGDSFAKWVKQL